MTFKRNLLLLVLAFLVNANLVLALIKPRIVTSPIVIDDIVAVGGSSGVVCGWGTYTSFVTSDMSSKGTFVPIDANSQKPERYKIIVRNNKSEGIEAFRIGVVGYPLIGIDPLKGSITYSNGDAVITSAIKCAVPFMLRIHPVDNGVEIYDETKKANFVLDALLSTYECKIDASWNPRFRIYPNPTFGLSKFTFFVPIATGVNIIVYDQSNTIVYQNNNLNAIDGYNEIDVDLSAQRPGLYTGILEIRQANGKIISKKYCLVQKM